MHGLLRLMLDAADGRFPPVDGEVTVLPPPAKGLAAIVCFTGHAVIAAAVTGPDAASRGADGFGGALHPRVLAWLGEGGSIGVIDAILVGHGTGGTPRLPAAPGYDDHPRVHHARQLRTNVQVLGDERGVVTLADGLAGRLELSVEAAPQGQGKGWGRSLVADALTNVDQGVPVFAAVSPGNARSLRTFLALGFVPIGSEVQILTEASRKGFR